MTEERDFRVNAKNIFITYPKSLFDYDELYEFIDTKYKVDYAIICQEKHQSGEDHMHGLFTLKKKANITKPDILDFKGRHPNIKAAINVQACKQYCKKGGNYREFFTNGEPEDDILTKARKMDPEEFFVDCVQKRISPGYYHEALRLANAQVTIDDKFKYEGKISSPILSITRIDWERESKSVVIIGPAGVGKSTLAIRDIPKPALLVSHLDTLRSFNEHYHKGILFDDISLKHIHLQGQLQVVCRELPRQVHVRYGVAFIPAGVPKIFTCNTFPFIDDPSIMRRINIINC